MSKKVKFMIYVACTLWIAVFAQIIITKAYVAGNDVTQAFARNQLAIEESSGAVGDVCKEGGWIMGKVSGKLSSEQKENIAHTFFGYEGGGCLFDQEADGYYVAYGFTNGIPLVKKVNGKTINMNIAITYDEEEDKSLVYFGVPVINKDF